MEQAEDKTYPCPEGNRGITKQTQKKEYTSTKENKQVQGNIKFIQINLHNSLDAINSHVNC